MLRLRRYRIFLIFAAITLAALYHFTSVRDWEEATAASVKTLHDYGVKHGNGGAPAEVTPIEQEPQEKIEQVDTPAVAKTPDAEENTPLVTPTGTSTHPAVANEPPQTSTTTTQQPTSASSAVATAEATTPATSPAAQKPTVPTDLPKPGLIDQEHIQPQDGHGSYEPPPLLPDKPLIHWTSLPEHFPVPTESLIQLPSGKPSSIPKVQFEFADETSTQKVDREKKLAAVKEAFQHSWKGYKDKAWLQDELSPVTGKYRNPFCGWAATLVDSLDTLWIMGLEEDFTEATLAVGEIDFTTSFRNDIPLFETTIRYLGGLVSAYDMSGGKYRVLLDKAVQLADVLMGAFDTPNRMPITYYFWKPTFASNPHRASVRAVLAELGSLSMEFTRLAQITKETRYYDAIARITNEFEVWQNNTKVPGLWPLQVDASGCRKSDTVAMTPVMHSALNGPHAGLMPPANPLHDPRYPVNNVDAGEAEEAQSTEKVSSSQEVKKSDIAETTASALNDEASTDDKTAGSAAAGSTAVVSDESTLSTSQYDEVDAKGRHYKAKIENWGGEIDSDEAGKVPIHHLKPPSAEETIKAALTKRQLVTEDLETSVIGPKVVGVPKNTPSEEAGSLPPLKQTKNEAGDYTSVANPVSNDDFDCKPQGFAPPPRSMSQAFTFGGQADSVYEYLPKQYLLLGGLVPQYQSVYEAAADAGIKHLLFRPMIPGTRDIRVLGKITTFETANEPLRYEYDYENSHLLCFSGGMYALGSKIFDRKEDLDIAAKLTDGCVWAYESTKTGIMPEGFAMIPCKSMKSCTFNETLWYEKLDLYRSFREQGQKTAQQQVLEQKLKEGVAGKANAIGIEPATNEPAAPKAVDHKAGDVEPATNGGIDADNIVPKATDFGGVSKPATDTEPSAPKAADGDKLPTEGSLAKRQLGDIENDPLLGPGTKIPTQATIEEANKALADKDDTAILQSLNDKPAISLTAATPTTPSNLYPTHEEYGRQRIANEGLPIGVPSISSRSYILRPEAIESVFIMYRISGDEIWREKGWKMFNAIQNYTRVDFGHSAIADVTNPNTTRTDEMESFWLAETLKYFYLLFSPPDVVSLDEWVLNTEAHPFKRPT